MTGSVALDVVIGLVFVYAIYSLFATIIFEMISERIGIRTRMFQYYLKLMLTDHYKWSFKDFTSKQKRDFRWAFLNQPSIRNLGRRRILAKEGASYLQPEMFSESLIDLISRNEADLNSVDAVQSGLARWREGQKVEELNKNVKKDDRLTNEIMLDEDTADYIQTLLDKSHGDVDRFKQRLEFWFEATMDRCKGGFKQITTMCLFVIGLIIAIQFNIDTLKIASILEDNSAVREEMIALASSSTQKDYTAFKTSMDKNLEDVSGVMGLGNFCLTENFIGCLITAFALSLGAPFWFDLLNKLMRLRTSTRAAGAGKEEKEDKLKIVG